MSGLTTTLRMWATALLVATTFTAHAGVPPWPEAPYSYFAQGARLDTALAEFATGFGLSLALSPEVGGTVNGRFAANTPTEFISRLASAYGFVWYTHGGTLYISRASDNVTRGLAAPGGNVAAMRKALADLGVMEPRFGWGELTAEGMALISGPPTYVNLLESTIRQLPAKSHQLMVFRLNHASAIDRVVNYRDQTITTPGMVTLLKAMVGAPGPVASVASASTAAPRAEDSGVPVGIRKPWIQADPRINAVIIQDIPERMPLYRDVIAQLDVPTALVEIEVLIIDVSEEKASELGVSWSGRIGRSSIGFGQGAAIAGAGAGLSASFSAANFILNQLRLLESKGAAEVQGRPSVLTSENLAAVLDLSETFYVRTQGTVATGNASTGAAGGGTTITPITAGTSLRVTPHVLRQDGRVFVQLKIDIEDGQITDLQVDTLPTVVRSTVSTEATLPHGEVLLIAGYKSSRDFKSRQQVPLLGDIPLLGALFSSETRSVKKRDRMILIRPRVVDLAEQGFALPAAATAPGMATENGVRLSLTGSLAIPPAAPAIEAPATRR